jgi:hypothetical protein
MAVSYTTDQLNTVSRLRNMCATILDQIAEAKLLAQEASDKGYGSGGANQLTDALLQTPAAGQAVATNADLTAADVFAAVTTINTLDTTLAATSRAGYKSLERMRP